MIYLYIATLVVGGVLLASSMLLGDHDADDLDSAFEGHADAAGDAMSSVLVGMRSLRFWIFFSAFFGLTGLVLTGFGVVRSPLFAFITALIMGLLIGGTATWVLRRLSIEEVGRVPTDGDYVGKMGRVLVAIEGGGMGKVRLSVGGTTVDVLAKADDESLSVDEEAVIIEMEGTVAKVTRFRTSGV